MSEGRKGKKREENEPILSQSLNGLTTNGWDDMKKEIIEEYASFKGSRSGPLVAVAEIPDVPGDNA